MEKERSPPIDRARASTFLDPPIFRQGLRSRGVGRPCSDTPTIKSPHHLFLQRELQEIPFYFLLFSGLLPCQPPALSVFFFWSFGAISSLTYSISEFITRKGFLSSRTKRLTNSHTHQTRGCPPGSTTRETDQVGFNTYFHADWLVQPAWIQHQPSISLLYTIFLLSP